VHFKLTSRSVRLEFFQPTCSLASPLSRSQRVNLVPFLSFSPAFPPEEQWPFFLQTPSPELFPKNLHSLGMCVIVSFPLFLKPPGFLSSRLQAFGLPFRPLIKRLCLSSLLWIPIPATPPSNLRMYRVSRGELALRGISRFPSLRFFFLSVSSRVGTRFTIPHPILIRCITILFLIHSA